MGRVLFTIDFEQKLSILSKHMKHVGRSYLIGKDLVFEMHNFFLNIECLDNENKRDHFEHSTIQL